MISLSCCIAISLATPLRYPCSLKQESDRKHQQTEDSIKLFNKHFEVLNKGLLGVMQQKKTADAKFKSVLRFTTPATYRAILHLPYHTVDILDHLTVDTYTCTYLRATAIKEKKEIDALAGQVHAVLQGTLKDISEEDNDGGVDKQVGPSSALHRSHTASLVIFFFCLLAWPHWPPRTPFNPNRTQ